ncbi:MAG TPA: hypothetical protein ENG59_03790 [Chloroflexi bacterium]|nr:hypothetical protein [Chloroflexota bacterium]
MARILSNKELAAQRFKRFRKMVADNKTYPLATVTYHGPSPEKASKIVVGILEGQDQTPLVRHWSGEDIAEDVETAREISHFIKDHAVSRVITSEWVLSCPHEEGVDYAKGEACPYCPDWH